MRYFKLEDKNLFFKEPKEFNKWTNKEILKYSLGANIYMNGGKDFFEKIISGYFSSTGAISICFEDAVKENEVKSFEKNVISNLDKLHKYVCNNEEIKNNIPMIFFRVRNYDQFINFAEKLNKEHFKYITGFIFPKFNSENGQRYLDFVKKLIVKYDEILYAMPILESEEIIYRETRMEELIKIKKIINSYKDIILNIRVGGTDFSSKFGLRRSVNSNIYNIKVVSECLSDILNMFLRESEDYVISAPVWEYFSEDMNSKEVIGLIKEINFDKENGFCGKTVIHPSQIKYVNGLYAITYEEYIDAQNILGETNDGGVFKGYGGNKMNEVKPHYNWAKKILYRAEIFGVLREGIENKVLYTK